MREVITLSVLLTAAMAASYTSWQAPELADDVAAKVVAIQADTSSLKKLVWTSEELDVTVERIEDAQGAWFRIETVERKKAKADPHAGVDANGDGAPDAPPADAAATDAAPVRTVFAGNDTAAELWTSFTPLRALRELEGADLSSPLYGFTDAKQKVQVARTSGDVTLTVGGETYGTKNQYVNDGSRAFLLESTTLKPLEFAKTRLMERRLHPLAEEKIERVEVVRGDARRTIVQANAADRAKAFWADADKPTVEDTTAGTWIGKALRLRVQSYPENEVGPKGELQPVFTLAFSGEGKTWEVPVFLDAGAAEKEYWAKPGFTRMPVKLATTLAAEALADLDTLFDPNARPADPAPTADANGGGDATGSGSAADAATGSGEPAGSGSASPP